MIDFLITELNLDEKRKNQINKFLEAHRLVPYVSILKQYPEIFTILSKIYPNKIKDNWDCVVELYRYNIKLSKSIYPYIYILENILKIRLSQFLENKYGESWYRDEELIFNTLSFDDIDKEICDKYFNHHINKIVREELILVYQKENSSLSKSQIKSKISVLKKAISILSDAREYCFKNSKTSLNQFIETKPTLNYWITILEMKNLFIDENTNICDFTSIFPNKQFSTERDLVEIIQKLNDIRLLRNGISHFSQIVFKNINEKNYIWNIYTNIITLLKDLGCEDINWVIGDIDCCTNSVFEHLYNELVDIHKLFTNN